VNFVNIVYMKVAEGIRRLNARALIWDNPQFLPISSRQRTITVTLSFFPLTPVWFPSLALDVVAIPGLEPGFEP
jgi:hypothetical protein